MLLVSALTGCEATTTPKETTSTTTTTEGTTTEIPPAPDPRCVGDVVCFALATDGADLALATEDGVAARWGAGPTGYEEVALLVGVELPSTTSRAFLDASTGAPRFLLDEGAGKTTVILQDAAVDPTQFFYLTFGADGLFAEGFLASVEGESLRVGRISGLPAFVGQITGQLEAAYVGGLTGSFAAVSLDAPIDTRAGPVATEDSFLVDDATFALASALLPPAVAPDLAALRTVAGALAVVGSDLGASAPLTALPAATVVARRVAADPASFEAGLRSSDPLAREATDLLVEALRSGDPASLGSGVAAAIDEAGRVLDGTSDGASSLGAGDLLEGLDGSSGLTPTGWDALGAAALEEFGETGTSTPDGLIDATELAALTPAASEAIGGQAVFQDNAVYELSGTVDALGAVVLSGPSAAGAVLNIEGQIDAAGAFSGIWWLDTEDGIAVGSVTPLGECETAQEAGNEGTFTFAHAVGTGPGIVEFYYDAYGIPDSFTVAGPEGELFSTGGLVSGDDLVLLDITTKGVVTLFVSVSAPNNGTAWEYEIGCLPE